MLQKLRWIEALSDHRETNFPIYSGENKQEREKGNVLFRSDESNATEEDKSESATHVTKSREVLI